MGIKVKINYFIIKNASFLSILQDKYCNILKGENIERKMVLGTKKENVKYKKRPGVYVIITRKNAEEVAICYDGDYFFFGGGIEKRETKKKALKRELLEETGYTLKNKSKFMQVTAYVNKGTRGPLKVKSTIYIAEFDKKVCKPVEKDHKVSWIKPEEYIGKLYHAYQNKVLEKYCQTKKKKR